MRCRSTPSFRRRNSDARRTDFDHRSPGGAPARALPSLAPALHVALMHLLRALLRDEGGQGITEYAIIIGTVAFAAIVAFIALGGRLNGILSSLRAQLNSLPTS